MKIKVMSRIDMNSIMLKALYNHTPIEAGIISISSSGFGKLPSLVFAKEVGLVPNVIFEEFDDIDMQVAYYYPITVPVAVDMVNFAKDLDEVWIHCDAGISRSAGVACALDEYYNLDGRSSFYWTDGYHHPNGLVYRTVMNVLNSGYIPFSDY